MKVKNLIILILVITILAMVGLGYLYFLRLDPRDAIKGVAVTMDSDKNPKFLFAINNEPEHPFAQPSAVTVVKNRIFVSDIGKGSVTVFDYNGKFQRFLKPGRESFKAPYGMTSDGDNIYVADPALGKIFVFDSVGNFLKIFDTREKLGGPGVLAYQNNKLYVSDQLLHKVLVFDTAGNLLKSYGSEGHEKGQLYFPHGFVVADGKIYVADSGNNRIVVFNESGTYAGTIGGEILTPRGLTMDSNGNLWVVEGLANTVKVLLTDGTQIMSFGTAGQDYGQISLPNGIFIDNNNRVYITEFGNSRVSVFGY